MPKCNDLWKIQLSLFETLDEVYFSTEFHEWESRIRKTHTEEVNRIKEAYEEAIASMTPEAEESGYDPNEIYGDRYSETCQITTKMYAGLVVALWSHMETSLGKLVSIAQVASSNRNTAIAELKDACDGMLEGKSAKSVELKEKIEAATSFSRTVWKFGDIKSALNRTIPNKLAVDCPSYGIMNSTRLLCNAFKHNEGCCDDQTFNLLDTGIRSQANIQIEELIDYSTLNIEVLVTGCKEAIQWICQEIKDGASSDAN